MGLLSDDRAPAASAASAASAAPAGPGAAHLTALVRSGPYLNGYHDVARQWPDAIRAPGRRRHRARRRPAPGGADAATTPAPTVRRVRERFWAQQGGRPGAGAARDAAFETHGELVHLGVRITKLAYEVAPRRPRLGPALPAGRPPGAPAGGARPGIVFVCGHHGTAKRAPEFQRVCLDLALHGMVVLAIDPWGQGERYQYPSPAGSSPLVPAGTFEHSYGGLQCLLTGGGVAPLLRLGRRARGGRPGRRCRRWTRRGSASPATAAAASRRCC